MYSAKQVGAVVGDCSTPNSQLFDNSAAASLSFTGMYNYTARAFDLTWMSGIGTAVNVTFYYDILGGDIPVYIDDKVFLVNNHGTGAVGPSSCTTIPVASGLLPPGNHTITLINTSSAHIFIKSFS